MGWEEKSVSLTFGREMLSRWKWYQFVRLAFSIRMVPLSSHSSEYSQIYFQSRFIIVLKMSNFRYSDATETRVVPTNSSDSQLSNGIARLLIEWISTDLNYRLAADIYTTLGVSP